MFPHKRCQRRQPKPTSMSCRRTGRRQAPLSVVPPSDYTCTVYRHPPGSGPAKQQKKKKDSDQKSTSATVSRLVEFPLTRGHDSKHGSQAREERMEILNESAKGAKEWVYIGGGVGSISTTCPLPNGGNPSCRPLGETLGRLGLGRRPLGLSYGDLAHGLWPPLMGCHMVAH
jgi:hypothetical protein